MPVCLNSQNYAPRYRRQLNALLPSAFRPRAIVHLAVHGTSGHSFDYSPNRHEITVYYSMADDVKRHESDVESNERTN